jgi:hypothetical protein
MYYSELNLREPEVETTSIKLTSGVEVAVRKYLPIDDKANLITWAINLALDDRTGCISPVRFEVCFALGVVKWYAGIEFDDDVSLSDIYDSFEINDVTNQVMGAIPVPEIDFLRDLAKDTAEDIVRYNNSFAGMISGISSDATNLDEQITEIVGKIKNAEGLETLSVIKDVVGTD